MSDVEATADTTTAITTPTAAAAVRGRFGGLASRRSVDLAVVALRKLLSLVSWAAVYFVIVLGAMTALIALTTGWDAVVISSSSMEPTLRVGDVLFMTEHPEDAIGQQAVITYERADGELVTHRVFETDGNSSSYITKGDANPSPDADVVERSQVRGVGTLVVPYIGLPVTWVASGDYLALGALGVLALFAIVASVMSSRSKHKVELTDERFSTSARRGITRVRLLVALMVSLFTLVNSSQFEFEAIGFSSLQTLVVTVFGLAITSTVATYRNGRTDRGSMRRLAMFELFADTLIIVFFVSASGTSGIGWVLMALPIIEAAIHFRLTGAFVHWVLMSALSVAALFWTNQRVGVPQSVAIGNLEQLIDRLGVLLMVVIPGSYLAEQLLSDVATQHRATRLARERSRMVEQVTESGREVARLDADLFPTLTTATLQLGFDCADSWIGDPVGGWRLLAAASSGTPRLSAPGSPGDGLSAADLVEAEIFVDGDDPDVAAVAALAARGMGCMIRLTLTQQDAMFVVVRVGAVQISEDPASQSMALRLLAAQAAVALQNGQLLSELRQTHAELAHQAKYDSLTELVNRKYFVAELSSTLERRDLDPRSIATMFLDLDGFKAVNDRIGHAAGDELLRQVAQRLRAAAGERGLVARLGGDEFTLLLVDWDRQSVDHLAALIHDKLGSPFDLGGDTVRVGVSIGIAESESGIAADEMLRRSDVAMYSAKSSGRPGATTRYSIDLDQRERRLDHLGRALVESIGGAGLCMVYQPVVSTSNGVVVGVEALVRWNDPTYGQIAAPEILEIAELAGCIDELNAWIFERSLVEMRSCALDDDLFVAVNVSPKELELDSLMGNLDAAITGSGLEPAQVVVELSERIVADALSSNSNVDRMIARGIRIALDDFGEGHTSLAHLRGFPISFLKLDRNFVLHAGESEEDRTILRSVVALAHDLGFEVIAEGVENIEQHGIVAKASADYVQGFGIYRPMPVDDLANVLAQSRAASEALEMTSLSVAALPPPMGARRLLSEVLR